VRIGLFTDGLKHLSRRDALAWAAAEGITDVEMSVGTWGARTHLDLATLLRDAHARDELRRDLDNAGIRFSAVNAAGNPLHPDPAARAEAQAAVKGAVELAALLGIDRVVTMAGSPGGRTGGGIGVFGLWSIANDDEPIWAWQMEQEVGPYWRAMSDWMASASMTRIGSAPCHQKWLGSRLTPMFASQYARRARYDSSVQTDTPGWSSRQIRTSGAALAIQSDIARQ
jgi:hypothetical protein